MIIRSENLTVEQRTGERNGTMTQLLSAEQMHGKSRLFAHIVLKPGSRVPYHQHNGDFEIYYILSGSGEANDNGVITQVQAGDVFLTENGESHSLENTGTTDLEYMAVVMML